MLQPPPPTSLLRTRIAFLKDTDNIFKLVLIIFSGELSLGGLILSCFVLVGPGRDAFPRAEVRRTGDDYSAAAPAAAAAHVDGR